MNIGILNTIMYTSGKTGYYHSQETGLAKELHDRGHTVCVYRCANANTALNIYSLDGVTIMECPTESVGVHGYMDTQYILKHTDCLVAFSDTQVFLPHVIRFCRKRGIGFIPYAGTVRSQSEGLKKQAADALFQITTSRYYRQMPVMAKTKRVAEQLEAAGAGRVLYAPAGMDPDMLQLRFREHDRAEIRNSSGYAEDDHIILFIGEMAPWKRHDAMLRIFRSVYEKDSLAKLIMIGKGKLERKIRSAAAQCGAAEAIRMIPKVPHEDIWKYYYIADDFVNLSEVEIYGMSVMEAVFYDTRVTAMHAPGPDDILEGSAVHTLCGAHDEVFRNLMSPLPDPQVLRQESGHLLASRTWKRAADAIEELARNAQPVQNVARK